MHATPAPTPPLGGADIELGNGFDGRPPAKRNCWEAARAIVAHIDGVPNRSRRPAAVIRPGSTYGDPDRYQLEATARSGRDHDGRVNPQDYGRKFLTSNGGCAYIDLGHTEICLPEVPGARAYVTYLHAMLRIVRDAQVAANAELADGERIRVMVNNSDGFGNSYGSHLNFMISDATWCRLFETRPLTMLFLASWQISSMIFTGAGKVGSENDRPRVNYQISQRADFFTCVSDHRTTIDRPLINLRDEPHSGAGTNRRRLHCIFFDSTLCHTSSYLKFGAMQIILAMIESGWVDTDLILVNPVEDTVRISHDPTLRTRVRTLGGTMDTAIDLQQRFVDAARAFLNDEVCLVPEAEEIVDLWDETLHYLREDNVDVLRRRIDWILKRELLDHTRIARRLDWSSPEMHHLDMLYGSLDPEDGLYLAVERSGLVDALASSAEIERATACPPEGTRAWTRARLLRKAEPGEIEEVDWDHVKVTTIGSDGRLIRRMIRLSDPAAGAYGLWHQLLDDDGVSLAELIETVERLRE